MFKIFVVYKSFENYCNFSLLSIICLINFKLFQLQLIVSVSRLLGDVVGLNNARLQESLSVINNYANSDKAMQNTSKFGPPFFLVYVYKEERGSLFHVIYVCFIIIFVKNWWNRNIECFIRIILAFLISCF